jgi:endonuclease YncB( thermonuclease family)
VNDGDTLRTTSGARIRLVQIDAPELHPDCYGKAALAALRRLAPAGAAVTLMRDPAHDASDRYGRRLRYVVAGGRNVNLELVREGAASPYFFHPVVGRYARDLLTAVTEAPAARRGYWGACPGPSSTRVPARSLAPPDRRSGQRPEGRRRRALPATSLRGPTPGLPGRVGT